MPGLWLSVHGSVWVEADLPVLSNKNTFVPLMKTVCKYIVNCPEGSDMRIVFTYINGVGLLFSFIKR